MTMIHLKYPRKKGFLYWDELGCLGKALGFSRDVFYRNIPDDVKRSSRGIDHQTFLQMIDFHKYFHESMDRSFNKHSDEWNLNVVKTALPLLDQDRLSFTDIQAFRMAFQTYEEQDSRGLSTNTRTLLRTLKMCDRMISPIKMNRLLKARSPTMEEPGRIQLHELFQLILWCDTYKKPDLSPQELNDAKSGEVYQLENLKLLLTPYDDRLYNSLDNHYLRNKWRSSQEKYGEPTISKDVPEVNTKTRYDLAKWNRQQSRWLRTYITSSQRSVEMARAGNSPARPVSAPEIPAIHDIHLTDHKEPTSLIDLAKTCLRPRTAPCVGTEPGEDAQRSKNNPHAINSSVAIVSERDVASTSDAISALQFEMAILPRKYQTKLEEDLQVMFPAWHGRPLTSLPQAKTGMVESMPKQKVSKQGLSNHLIMRKPQPPPTTHAKTCDARFRGWLASQTRGRKHYILVKSTYDNSPNGAMFTKMQYNDQKLTGKQAFVRRSVTTPARKKPITKHSMNTGTTGMDLEAETMATQKLDRVAECAFEADKREILHNVFDDLEQHPTAARYDEIIQANKNMKTENGIDAHDSAQTKKSNDLGSVMNGAPDPESDRSDTPHSNLAQSPACLSSAPSSASYNSIGIVIKDNVKQVLAAAPSWVDDVLKKPHLLSKSRTRKLLPSPLILAEKRRLHDN